MRDLNCRWFCAGLNLHSPTVKRRIIGSRSNLENPPKTRLDLSRIFGGGGLVDGGSINSASQLIFSLNLNSDEFVKFESLADLVLRILAEASRQMRKSAMLKFKFKARQA